MESHHNFKRLTVENWNEPDEASALFYCLTEDGHPRPMTGDDWAQQFLTPQLSASVPAEVQKLFEVARGSLIYGYFFYPLYTLGQEQLLRVVETAVMMKCGAMCAPAGVRGFQNGVEYLVKHGVIAKAQGERWNGLVQLRNLTSHPIEQSIIFPCQAVTMLHCICEAINSLF